MTVISTLAGTHQGSYKLLTEKAQHNDSIRNLEDTLWKSFCEDTPFGAIVTDLENAFSTYSKNVLSRMPGMDVVTGVKIRPDLSNTRFNEAGISGCISFWDALDFTMWLFDD